MIPRIFVVPLTCLVLVISGCQEDGPEIDVQSSIPVRVEEIKYQPFQAYAFATGTVSAVKEATLKAQQAGYYQLQSNPRTGRPFAMGDRVVRGEVIVRLVNAEFENQIGYDSKKLNHDISQREYDKQKALYDKGGVTLRELTDAERTFIDARYSFDNATLQLAKLSITAPFNGYLVDLPFYSANQLVEVGSLICQVMDYSRLYSEVTLPGKEMSRVKQGQETLVTNYGRPDDTLFGVVTQVSPALDPDSRMFKVGIEISNDSLFMRPGMFAKIDIIVERRDSAIVIPKDIVLERRGDKVVYVVDRGIAVEHHLDIGLSNRQEVEVLNGLEVNDRLVVEGFETLRNRSKVKVTK
ncbi:MAG: efflux RND transporter periplasmic adaptor subunit [Candidatus Zixiibacteriota bacterium]|nr:MAG: efflux RND transporter periplasmic adaptor subunit [candidate division Zixibacteria bacterium]